MLLKVESPNYNFEGIISRRITVIKGDSGLGKTTLVSRLTLDSPAIQISCELTPVVATDTDWEILLEHQHDAIIFFDDMRCTESARFADLCKKHLIQNNLYVVVISRAPVGPNMNWLFVSAKEIYKMVSNGPDHWLEPIHTTQIQQSNFFK